MIWHDKTAEETIRLLGADSRDGLSEKEARRRLSEHGKNILHTPKKSGFLRHFFAQFQDFMILILLAAAFLSFLTSWLHQDTDWVDPIMILGIVVFNAILGVVQENRAERSLEALKKITSPTAHVRRSGKIMEIPAEEVVPGDLLILKTGDRIPADCRLISAVQLQTDESSLTGESGGIWKSAEGVYPQKTPPAERKNLAYASSLVLGGKAEAIAVETGMNTEVGKIAGLILDAGQKETPLQKKLSEVGKNLGWIALFICGVIFFIGLFRRIPPFDMFLTSVSLAVAAIPEGLPAIVTIMLAIGVQRMAKQNAIIRNLPSVETLGSASVICSDKTGTLTENKMTVTKIAGSDKTLFYAVLCSDPDSTNPTESAILSAAQKQGISKTDSDKKYPRISEIPFDSRKKRMITVHKKSSGYCSIIKGAPDVLLSLCSRYQSGESTLSLTDSARHKILTENEEMTSRALRVLAVAYRDTANSTAAEEQFVFLGLIGIEDPPRPEAAQAVAVCREAGIIPVMITGDHANTAAAVAKQVGILSKSDRVLTGTELSAMSQEDLEKNVEHYSVYARVTPEHKVRIVRAWQKRGAVVAMTGDGVNDAPALKTADIGCSMGKNGTDVAKSASDMILTDDNFATIVAAVRQGRAIFANIKKAVQFLLSSNIGEILTILFGLLFGSQTTLLAIQLLWVNLVTDSLPAIALGLDPPEKDLMKHPPRSPKKGLFADGLWWTIAIEGGMIGGLALLAFTVGRIFFDCSATLEIGRTMSFCVLSLSQLVHAFNMRSERSVFSVGILSNPYLVGAFLIGVILQVGVVSVPMLSPLFRVVPLNALQWSIVGLLSFAPLPLVELQKLFGTRRKETL